MLRLRGSERVVRKPDRFVYRLRLNQDYQNLSEDREPLFTSSGNQSFRYTVRFALILVILFNPRVQKIALQKYLFVVFPLSYTPLVPCNFQFSLLL